MYLLCKTSNILQPPQALKRPTEAEEEEDEQEKTRKMRRIARAKASKMTRPPSPTPSIQTLDQISEEERAEILKFVETEQTQVLTLTCIMFLWKMVLTVQF